MAKKETKVNTKPTIGPALGKENFIIIGISVLLVIIGFILMSGGGSDDPNIFSWALFSPRRLVVAPILIVGGFSLAIYGIMKKTKS